MLMYHNSLLIKQKKFYLDYVHFRTLIMIPRPFSQRHFLEMLKRRNILKNVTLNILLKVKQKKKVPMLR